MGITGKMSKNYEKEELKNQNAIFEQLQITYL